MKKVHGIWLEKFIDFAENVHAFRRKEKMNKTSPIKKEKEKTVPKTKKKKTIPANKKKIIRRKRPVVNTSSRLAGWL